MKLPKISRRTNGLYYIQISIGKDPVTGKTIRKTLYGRTKGEVKQKASELLESIDRGEVIPTSRLHLTVKEWCLEWLELYSFKLANGSKRKYKSYINKHIIPYIGHIELVKLSPLHCQHFINDLLNESNLSEGTINHLATFFSSLLKKAVQLGYIGKNPCEHLEIPKKKVVALNPFSEDEARCFMDNCQNQSIDNLCKLALFTGLRQHEIMALTWENIENDNLRVDHQFGRNKTDLTFYPTKNKRTRRIGLNESALSVLKQQKLLQAQSRISSGINYRNDLNLIFTDEKGKRLHCNTVNRRFKEICKKVGRTNVRFHDLRHTYAVISIKAGVDMKSLSESLGHSSVSFTLDQYAYVTDKMRKETAQKIEVFLQSL